MASSKKDRDGLFRRGQIYYCWIRGERVSTRCRSRKAALAVRDKLERASVDPVYRASHTATVGELCRLTLEEVKRRGRSKATLEYYTSKLGHLVRVLGEETPLAKFASETVDDYIDKRRDEGASQHNISKELGAWRHMLRVAKRRGSFAGDIEALFPIGFASGYEPRRRSLAWDEIPRLLGAFEKTPRLRGWVALAIATGGREAEVGRVERGDISPGLDVVQIRGSKTDLSDDAIAVPMAFRWLLEEALKHGSQGYDAPLVGNWANSVRDLEAACKRAGIAKVSANDLRRTHSTLLRAAGAPLDLVARQLRHADTRMVEKTYGRLTAAQVFPLLPTVQYQHSASPCEGTGDYIPAENIGVSDGDRTRDTWSHKPESHLPEVGSSGIFGGALDAGTVLGDGGPTRFSTLGRVPFLAGAADDDRMWLL
jgi:integrase